MDHQGTSGEGEDEMSAYLQFLAALISYDLLRAVVPPTCKFLRTKFSKRGREKPFYGTDYVNYKPQRETR